MCERFVDQRYIEAMLTDAGSVAPKSSSYRSVIFVKCVYFESFPESNIETNAMQRFQLVVVVCVTVD